jgi:hypothetical protein
LIDLINKGRGGDRNAYPPSHTLGIETGRCYASNNPDNVESYGDEGQKGGSSWR